MIIFPSLATLPTTVMADVSNIAREPRAARPADTAVCAYGVGHDVWMWSDESEGGYFDLASLTKPLFTVLTVLSLLSARGALDEPVGKILLWLPQESTTPSARQLLTQASGLPAELPTDRAASDVRSWVSAALAEAERDVVASSDVGYWLLGETAATVTGDCLPALFAGAPTATDDAFVFWQAPADTTPGGHHSLAWILAGDALHVVAHDWPPTRLCHTGFTGVSVALDPVSQWVGGLPQQRAPGRGDVGPILRAQRLHHAAAAAHLRATTTNLVPITS
jgi:hypothetical protein